MVIRSLKLPLATVSAGLLALSAACGAGGQSPTVGESHISGERILFSSERDGDWDIYSMFADGSRLVQLTTNMAYDWTPSWSPDGKSVIYTSNYLEGQFQQRMSEDGTKETFEVVGDQEIYVMSPNGTTSSALTDNDIAMDGHPVWSPDGSQIAFHSDSQTGGVSEIHVMDADGSNIRKLTDIGGVNWDPAWSPDGQMLVFSHLEDSWSLYTVNADGSGLRSLDAAGSGWKPAWSPDGTQIAFASDRTGNWNIYVMEADGSNPRRLTPGNDNGFEPVWSPDGSRIAFASNRARVATEVFVMNSDGTNVTPTGQQGIPSDWALIE
jgi:Tol biopolymer transport system component